MVRRIGGTLEKRIVTAVNETRLVALTLRGCPQGGVLSSLFCPVVVDDLLVELNCQGILAQGYANYAVEWVERRAGRPEESGEVVCKNGDIGKY